MLIGCLCSLLYKTVLLYTTLSLHMPLKNHTMIGMVKVMVDTFFSGRKGSKKGR